jgi:hypothetical protein
MLARIGVGNPFRLHRRLGLVVDDDLLERSLLIIPRRAEEG